MADEDIVVTEPDIDAEVALLQRLIIRAAVRRIEMLDKLLPPKNVISFKELKQLFCQKVNRSLNYIEEEDEELDPEELGCLWEVSRSDSSKDYWDLTANAEEGKSKYDKNAIFLRFHPAAENPELDECWSARCGEHKHELQSMFAGPLYGFDAAVWRLASGVCKLSREGLE